MKKQYVAAADLGGTKMALGIFGPEGAAAEQTLETRAKDGPEQTLARMADALYGLAYRAGVPWKSVAALGVCAPGPLDLRAGRILEASSMGWSDVPLRAVLSDRLELPVVLENDANAAALAERRRGAGSGLEPGAIMAYVTVSTGVGCGILVGETICHGRHDSAGELGHLCVVPDGLPCACGKRGCLETYASGTAVGRRYAAHTGAPEDCRTAAQAARQKDAYAQACFAEMGEKLGFGLAALTQLLDPHLIVIGGGAANAWDLFYHNMIKELARHTYDIFARDLAIVPAKLGGRAGLVGAAELAWGAEDAHRQTGASTRAAR